MWCKRIKEQNEEYEIFICDENSSQFLGNSLMFEAILMILIDYLCNVLSLKLI